MQAPQLTFFLSFWLLAESSSFFYIQHVLSSTLLGDFENGSLFTIKENLMSLQFGCYVLPYSGKVLLRKGLKSRGRWAPTGTGGGQPQGQYTDSIWRDEAPDCIAAWACLSESVTWPVQN